MIYDIRQVTTYDYASVVAYARHVLRLMPIDRPGQRVHALAVLRRLAGFCRGARDRAQPLSALRPLR